MHRQSAVIDDRQARLPVVQTSLQGKCYGRPEKTAKIGKTGTSKHQGLKTRLLDSPSHLRDLGVESSYPVQDANRVGITVDAKLVFT